MKKTVLKSFTLLNEVISRYNVLDMAELIVCKETKNLIRYSGHFSTVAHARLCEDLFHKDELGYILSDNYDIVQTVALFLCEHFGKHVDDAYMVDKKGKVITIKHYCYKLIARMICSRYRAFKRNVDLEKVQYIEEQKTYEAQENEYKIVDKMMDKMQLTDYHRKVLTHRMAGLSMSEIGRLFNRSAGAIGSVIYTVQKRYKQYIQEN